MSHTEKLQQINMIGITAASAKNRNSRKRSRRHGKQMLALAAVAVLAISVPAWQAHADNGYTGSVTGPGNTWNTAGNWSLGTIPTYSDTVDIGTISGTTLDATVDLAGMGGYGSYLNLGAGSMITNSSTTVRSTLDFSTGAYIAGTINGTGNANGGIQLFIGGGSLASTGLLEGNMSIHISGNFAFGSVSNTYAAGTSITALVNLATNSVALSPLNLTTVTFSNTGAGNSSSFGNGSITLDNGELSYTGTGSATLISTNSILLTDIGNGTTTIGTTAYNWLPSINTFDGSGETITVQGYLENNTISHPNGANNYTMPNPPYGITNQTGDVLIFQNGLFNLTSMSTTSDFTMGAVQVGNNSDATTVVLDANGSAPGDGARLVLFGSTLQIGVSNINIVSSLEAATAIVAGAQSYTENTLDLDGYTVTLSGNMADDVQSVKNGGNTNSINIDSSDLTIGSSATDGGGILTITGDNSHYGDYGNRTVNAVPNVFVSDGFVTVEDGVTIQLDSSNGGTGNFTGNLGAGIIEIGAAATGEADYSPTNLLITPGAVFQYTGSGEDLGNSVQVDNALILDTDGHIGYLGDNSTASTLQYSELGGTAGILVTDSSATAGTLNFLGPINGYAGTITIDNALTTVNVTGAGIGSGATNFAFNTGGTLVATGGQNVGPVNLMGNNDARVPDIIDASGAAGTSALLLGGSISNSTHGVTLLLEDGAFNLTSTDNSMDFTNGTLQIGDGSANTATVQFGSVGSNPDENLPSTGAGITLDNGTLEYIGDSDAAIVNIITLAGSGTISTANNKILGLATVSETGYTTGGNQSLTLGYGTMDLASSDINVGQLITTNASDGELDKIINSGTASDIYITPDAMATPTASIFAGVIDGGSAGAGGITLTLGSVSTTGMPITSTFSGTLSGKLELVFQNIDGSANLGVNANDFSGGTTIENTAQVQFGNGSSFGNLDTDIINLNQGEIVFNPDSTVSGSYSATMANNIILSNSTGTSTNTIDAGNNFNTGITQTNTFTLNGSLSNSFSGNTLILQDGTFNITGTNSGFSTGTLQIGDGTGTTVAQFGAQTDLPGSGADITLDDGTFQFTGSGINVANATTLDTAGGTIDVNGNINIWSGAITDSVSGSAELNVINSSTTTAGTVTLTSASNAWSGGTVIGGTTDTQNTTLAVTGTAVIGSGLLTVNAKGTLDMSGGTVGQTVAGLTGSGNVSLGANTLTVNGGTAQTFSGSVTGTGGLTVTGTGTSETLSGINNSYSGDTTVNSGATLDVTGTLTGIGNVIADGTVEFNNGTTTIIDTLSGTGTLDLENTTTTTILEVTGTATGTGAGASSTFDGALEGNGTLEASDSTVTIDGTGALTNFTGNLTAINTGNIIVTSAAGQFASTTDLSINNNQSITVAYGNLNSNAVNFSDNTGSGGTLTVNGTYVPGASLGAISMSNTGTATTNIIDASGSGNILNLGAITSTGTAANTLILQDGTFNLTAVSSFNAGDTFQIGNGTTTTGIPPLPATTVTFSSGSYLPGTDTIILDDGELAYTGTTSVTVGNAINDEGTINIIDDNGQTSTDPMTLSGSITNTTGTLLLQNGTFNLTGTNGATINPTFSGGTLQVGNGSGTTEVEFAAATNLPGSGAGITLDAGELAYTGTGEVTLVNAITLTGSGTITGNGQTVQLDGVTGATQALSLQNGTYDLNGTGITVGQLNTDAVTTITNSSTSTQSDITITPDAMTTPMGSTIDGNIDGGTDAGILFTLGSGSTTGTAVTSTISGVLSGNLTMVFTGIDGNANLGTAANSFTGGTTVENNAVVQFGNGSSFGNLDTDIINLNQGEIVFNPDSTGSGSYSATMANNIILSNSTGTSINTIDAGNNFNTGITQTNTLTLNGSLSNSFSGNTLILQDGTIVLGSTSNSTDFTIGTLQIGDGTNPSIAEFSGAVDGSGVAENLPGVDVGITLDDGELAYTGTTTTTVVNAITDTAGTNNVIDAGGVTSPIALILNGSITNTSGTLTLQDGTIDLSGTNDDTFSGGTLQIGNGSAIGTPAVPSSVAEFASATNLPSSTNNVGITLDDGELAYIGSVNTTVNNAITDTANTNNIIDAGGVINPIARTFHGSITNTIGTLTLQDGTFDLTGTNNVTFSGGTLQIGNGTTIGNPAGPAALVHFTSLSELPKTSAGLTLDAGTLQYGATALNVANAMTVDAAGGTLDIDGNGFTDTYSGVISGAGLLTLTSSFADNTGSVVILNPLTGSDTTDNTYTGGTDVTNGLTAVAESSYAFGSGALTVGAESTVDTINSYNYNINTGSLDPASTGETISVGNYTQDTDSTLNFVAFGRPVTGQPASGTYDSLALTGVFNLDNPGTALNLTFSSVANSHFTHPADFDTYTLITAASGGNSGIAAAGGANGNAATVENGNMTYGTGWYQINPGTAGNNNTGYIYPTYSDLNYYEVNTGDSETVAIQTLFLPYAITPNEKAVALYIDQNATPFDNVPGPMKTALANLSLMSQQDIDQALNILSPEAYSGIPAETIQNSTFLNQQVFGQVQNAFQYGGINTSGLTLLKTSDQDPFSVSMDAALQSAQQQARNSVAYLDPDIIGMPGGYVPPADENDIQLSPDQTSPNQPSYGGVSGFLLGTVTFDQYHQDDNPSEHFTTGGILAGLDYRVNQNLVAGALFNWGYTGGTLDNAGSRQQSSSYTPGVFVGYQKSNFFADALASYTYNTYRIDRNVDVGGNNSLATGKPNSNQFDAAALIGYMFPVAKGLKIGPAAGVGYTHIDLSGFSETGSGPFDLNVDSQSTDSLRSLLGGQLAWTIFGKPDLLTNTTPAVLNVNLNAYWQHEFLNNSSYMTANFTGLSTGSFQFQTSSPTRDAALIGGGISGNLSQGCTLFANYEVLAGTNSQFSQSIMVGLAVSF